MNIIFRVDSSKIIGTGHLHRCINLANELKNNACNIIFVSRNHKDNSNKLVEDNGFELISLPRIDFNINKNYYESWIGASQKEDAKETLNALKGIKCDLLIIDHYGIDEEWETKVKNFFNKIFVIDDLANRQHNCDFLLDQNFRINSNDRYVQLVPKKCKLLLGPNFALLNDAFRQQNRVKNFNKEKRLFIFMGGSDKKDFTQTVINILDDKLLSNLQTDFVVGKSFFDNIDKKLLKKTNSKIFFHPPQPHLADLMSKCDIAIGAGGVTNLERMCIGIPSIVISVAENQVEICKELSSLGLVNYLGGTEKVNPETLKSSIVKMTENDKYLKKISLKNQSIVDGYGAKRVAEIIMPSSNEIFKIRKANEKDVFIYFKWTNEPIVRKNSLNSSEIDLEDHINWYNERLENNDSELYILETKGLPIGQIRFDIKEKNAYINYSIDSIGRGRGLANYLLLKGILEFTLKHTFPLMALVKPENIASIKSFVRLGFIEQDRLKNGVRLFMLPVTNQEKIRKSYEDSI